MATDEPRYSSRWHGELGESVIAGNHLTPGELGILLANVWLKVSLFCIAEAFSHCNK
jgi:hypothetical protein